MNTRLQRFGLIFLILLILLFLSLQIFVSYESQNRAASIIRQLDAINLNNLTDEKTREEIAALRIENEQKTLFLQNFLTNFNIAIGVLVTISGAYLGFTQFINLRQKEQDDRQKERSDRSATDLSTLWKGITSDSKEERAGSIAGLQQFLTQDKQEFHERVASALALAGRINDNDPVIRRTLVPIIEYALHQTPDAMKRVSWQGLKLSRCNFSGLDLTGFDFRDAVLEEADFRGATLVNARFNAARLLNAKFDHANLTNANLEYADLANASFREANCTGANLRNVKIFNLDLAGAVLNGAEFSEFALDWRLALNWRSAIYNQTTYQRLLSKYGPLPTGPKILMLLWEFPPMVLGGTWSAAFHLINNLRRRGANLIVMVPWPPMLTSYLEYGNEIKLVPVGEFEPGQNGKSIEAYSEYSWLRSTYSYDKNKVDADAPSLLDMANQFSARAIQVIEDQALEFDVIHAQDWLTFKAAELISEKFGKPWSAHFHSTEFDRRTKSDVSNTIRIIEMEACRRANRLVTPSCFTRDQLVRQYHVPEAKVTVVPNGLSSQQTQVFPVAEFQTATVVFIGRYTWQKGPDTFVEMAHKVKKILPDVRFQMYGKGDMGSLIDRNSYIENYDIPNPQVVDPQSPRESGIELALIEPVRYNPVTQKYTRLGIYSERKRVEMENTLLNRGFTAYALVGDGTYTHRIEARALNDNFHPYYLVNARGLMPARQDNRIQVIENKGYLDWKRRWRAYEGATIVVVPSRSEPFGMVILEAFQSGVPVVFSNIAGVGEVLNSGIRVAPDDCDGFVQAVVKLIQDADYWDKTANDELTEIQGYFGRDYDLQLWNFWKDLVKSS